MFTDIVNISDILKDCPERRFLYSPLYGEVIFIKVNEDKSISVSTCAGNSSFDAYGRFCEKGECLLFPSAECRTWSPGWQDYLIKPKDKVLLNNDIYTYLGDDRFTDGQASFFEDLTNCKFAPKVYMKEQKFNPFDKVVVRNGKLYWAANLFSHMDGKFYITMDGAYEQCLPYEEYKYLIGTNHDI